MVAFASTLLATLLLASKALAAPTPDGGSTWSLNLWCAFDVLSEAEGPPKMGAKFTTRAAGSVSEAEAARINREIGMWSRGQYTATSAPDKKIVTVKSKKRTRGQCNDEIPKMKPTVLNGLKTKDPLERKPVPAPAPAPPSRPAPPPPSRPAPPPPNQKPGSPKPGSRGGRP